MKALARNLWDRVATPKTVTLFTAFTALVGVAGGVYAIINPPMSPSGAFGSVAMATLASMLVLGCVIVLVTSLIGFWFLEKQGLKLIIVAFMIYLGMLLVLHYEGSGNRLLQATAVWFAIAGAVGRYFHVHGRSIAPREEKVISSQPYEVAAPSADTAEV